MARSFLFSVGFHLVLMAPWVSPAQFAAPPAFDVERGFVSVEWVPHPADPAGEGPGGRAKRESAVEPAVERIGAWLKSGVGPLRNPAPPYPWLARRNGWQGTVLLQGRIDLWGRPALFRVSKSSGHEVLDQSALATIRRWQFVPARQGEQRVAQAVEIPVTFRLENREETFIP